MADKNNDQENTNSDAPMDSTRMDIAVNSERLNNMTKTSIGRMGSGLDRDTIEEKLAGRRGLLDKIGLGRLARWYSRFRTVKTNGSTLRRSAPLRQASLIRSPIVSAAYPYLYLWVAPPDWKTVPKLIFYINRIFVVLLGIGLNLVLFKNYFDAQQAQNSLAMPLVILAGVCTAITLLSVPFKLSPGFFVGAPFAGILILANLQVWLSTTSENTFIVLWGHNIGDVLNLFLILVTLLQIFFLMLSWPFAGLLKLPFILPGMFGIAGLATNMLAKRYLESAWTGSLWFEKIPLIFAQPVFVLLQGYFPLVFVLSLIWFLLFWKKLQEQRKSGWLIMHLLVTLLATGLGVGLLYQHRLPHLLMTFIAKPEGLGMTEIKWEEHTIRLETKNYEAKKDQDKIERYHLRLIPMKAKEKNTDKAEFILEILDASGFPVLFQEKQNYIISVDEEKLKTWDMKTLGPGTNLSKIPQAASIDAQTAFQVSFKAAWAQNPFTVSDFQLTADGWSLKINGPETGEKKWAGYELTIDGKDPQTNHFDMPLTEGTISIGALDEGKHDFTIVLEDDAGEKYRLRRSLEVKAQKSERAWVVSPMEGDTVENDFSVVVWPPDDQRDAVEKVDIFVDDETAPVVSGSPSVINVSLAGKESATLRVVVNMKGRAAHEEKIKITVGSKVGSLLFKRPYLGEFLSGAVPVELGTEGAKAFTNVELLVNGQSVHQWAAADSLIYEWDTTGLAAGEYLLQARGTTAEGQVSSWSWTTTGVGAVKVVPPIGKAKVGFKKVVFVLDASASQQDGFDGQGKWDWEKDIFKDEKVNQRLSESEAGILVFGASKRAAVNDCKDVQWLVKPDEYSRKKAREGLQALMPKGVSGLKKAVQLALEAKPQKIIIITDSKDACGGKEGSEISKDFKKVPGLIVDVVSLGAALEPEYLKRIAKDGDGVFLEVADGAEFIDEMVSLLSLRYEIYQEDKLVQSAPLDSREIMLKPGKYRLKVAMEPPFKDVDFEVFHRQRTELRMMTSAESTTAQEKKEAMR